MGAQPPASAPGRPAKSCCSAEWFETLLQDIVGMEELKDQLRKLRLEVVLDERRRQAGRKMPGARGRYHMVLKGNPGTGKTTVARLIANMLHAAGVLRVNKVVEAHRSSLVGEFVGQTGPKTRAQVDQARGGVLFVDEAYRLSKQGQAGQHDYGLEAIEELQQAMDEEDSPLMIFAGYPQPMTEFIATNPGLFRRITYPHILFPNHTIASLAEILRREISKQGFELGPDHESVQKVLQAHTTAAQRESLNGGVGEKVFHHAKHSLNSRIDENDMNPSCTISHEDLVQGCKALPHPSVDSSSYRSRPSSGHPPLFMPQPS